MVYQHKTTNTTSYCILATMSRLLNRATDKIAGAIDGAEIPELDGVLALDDLKKLAKDKFKDKIKEKASELMSSQAGINK